MLRNATPARDAHADTTAGRREYRALPARGIDLMRDGVPRRELRERGDRAVWDALGQTALFAINAGWSYAEWFAEVLKAKSKLGLQVRVDTKGRELPDDQVRKQLRRAWDRAQGRVDTHPAWDREEATAEAHERAAAVHRFLDREPQLPPNQRRILAYAAERAIAPDRAGAATVVNLPQKATAEAIGLTPRAVRHALDQLVLRGLLTLAERGRRRREGEQPKANAYRLPDPKLLSAFLSPVNGAGKPSGSDRPRQVSPSAETPVDAPCALAPEQPKTGKPSPPAPTPEETPVNHLTLSLEPDEQQVMLEALAAYRRQKQVAAVTASGESATVTPLDAARTAKTEKRGTARARTRR